MMKKGAIIVMGAALLMSSCGSYEASGAYTGSMFGNMIGSAIGGIAGGWRGHEIGSLIGTVSGAAIGASIGASAERKEQKRYEEYAAARQRSANRTRSVGTRSANPRTDDTYYDNNATRSQNSANPSGYDPQMRGDDRITFSGSEGVYPTEGNASPESTMGTSTSYMPHSAASALEIRHAGVYETERDGLLTRGETCKVVFEIVNNSNETIYDVFPLVEETTGNKHVHISPNLRIESLTPHQAIRYTATLATDNGLKNGQIQVRVGVAQGNNVMGDQTRQFTVPTSKSKR